MKKFINVYSLRNNDKFTINIENDGKEYELFYTDKAEIDSELKSVLKSDKSEIEIEDPVKGKRTYFVVKMDGFEDEIFAERRLPLKGACNFRDLGGFKTQDNRRVKWNRFYRSDALNILTKDDIKYLEDMGLRGILDYRAKSEAEQEKDLEITGAMYFNIPAMKTLEDEDENMKGNFNMEFLLKNIDKIPQFKDPTKFMVDSYKSMVFKNKAFEKMIEMMEVKAEIPFVQHCKSGKDRTGIGSALILLMLGVSLEEAKKDYLASNDYRKEYNEMIKAKFELVFKDKRCEEIFSFMMEVKEEYFDATFDFIFEKYPTIEEYFEKEYNLTSERVNNLRDDYLY
ncbi:MAG: tyrosine-protein phosphatase [Sarcina sp.]